VTPDGAAGPTGEGGFRAEPGRYHLYASFGCPWATRVLIARKLKRLEDVVSVAIVEPMMTDEGWRFGDYPAADRDAVNGATYLHEIYTRADPHFTGRATVPALWDKQRRTIVNNESADLLRTFNSGFGALADAHRPFPPICGRHRRAERPMRRSTAASIAPDSFPLKRLTRAFGPIFATLDMLERRLKQPIPVRRPACGNGHSRLRDPGALRRRLRGPSNATSPRRGSRSVTSASRAEYARHRPRQVQP
jgi:putative glutathione S-transferase